MADHNIRKASAKGRQFIKGWEKFVGTAYLDQAGRWTIGYGFIDGVRKGDTMTLEEAEARFLQELAPREAVVYKATRDVPTTQGQFDAMVALVYNIGSGDPARKIDGFLTSTVLRRHRDGNYLAASRAFGLWNKVTDPTTKKKVESRGLTNRRREEANMYLADSPKPPKEADALHEGNVQPVPESKLSASPIGVTTTVAGTSAGIAAVSEVVSEVAHAKNSFDNLGTWAIPMLLLVVIVVLCVYIWRQRKKQREEGWA